MTDSGLASKPRYHSDLTSVHLTINTIIAPAEQEVKHYWNRHRAIGESLWFRRETCISYPGSQAGTHSASALRRRKGFPNAQSISVGDYDWRPWLVITCLSPYQRVGQEIQVTNYAKDSGYSSYWRSSRPKMAGKIISWRFKESFEESIQGRLHSTNDGLGQFQSIGTKKGHTNPQ